MPAEVAPYGRSTKRPPDVGNSVLWITAGLGCDGDRSPSRRSQPSVEDVLLGAIPGLPKVICTTQYLPTRWATTS